MPCGGSIAHVILTSDAIVDPVNCRGGSVTWREHLFSPSGHRTRRENRAICKFMMTE